MCIDELHLVTFQSLQQFVRVIFKRWFSMHRWWHSLFWLMVVEYLWVSKYSQNFRCQHRAICCYLTIVIFMDFGTINIEFNFQKFDWRHSVLQWKFTSVIYFAENDYLRLAECKPANYCFPVSYQSIKSRWCFLYSTHPPLDCNWLFEIFLYGKLSVFFIGQNVLVYLSTHHSRTSPQCSSNRNPPSNCKRI